MFSELSAFFDNKYAPKNMAINFEDLTIEERGGPITDKDKGTRLAEKTRGRSI